MNQQHTYTMLDLRLGFVRLTPEQQRQLNEGIKALTPAAKRCLEQVMAERATEQKQAANG